MVLCKSSEKKTKLLLQVNLRDTPRQTDDTRAIMKQYKPATTRRFAGDCDCSDMISVVDKLQPWRKMTSTRDASTTPEEKGIANED